MQRNKGTGLIGSARKAEEEVLGITTITVDVYRSGVKMYSSEYTFGFSGPAALHLAAPSSPRHERQCRTGS
jgi:hypothetical protein